MDRQNNTYALYCLGIDNEQVMRHNTPIMMSAKESRYARKMNKGTAVHAGTVHPTILPFGSTLYLEIGEDFSWADERKRYLQQGIEDEAHKIKECIVSHG